MTALSDPAAFFDAIRPLFRKLTAEQVAGINVKLDAFGAAGWPIAFAAYGLATSFHETGWTMQPVREIGRGRGKTYGRPGRFAGQVPYGRGDVQLTWDSNYATADRMLQLGGTLTANFDRALEPGLSARIMVSGMARGWFTGRKLADYLPAQGPAKAGAFVEARRIINGMDRAEDVARYAMTFQQALTQGGWA